LAIAASTLALAVSDAFAFGISFPCGPGVCAAARAGTSNAAGINANIRFM
jgi:hypothetical protein